MADEGQAIRAIAPACTFSAAPCGYRFLVFKIFMTALQRVKSQCRGQGRLRQNMDLGERVFGSEDLRFRGPEVMFETSNISLSLSLSLRLQVLRQVLSVDPPETSLAARL